MIITNTPGLGIPDLGTLGQGTPGQGASVLGTPSLRRLEKAQGFPNNYLELV